MVEPITDEHGTLLPGRSPVAAQDGWIILASTTDGPVQRWFATDRMEAIRFLQARREPSMDPGSDQGAIFKIHLTPDTRIRGYVKALRHGDSLLQ